MGESVSRFTASYYLACPVFNNNKSKIMRHAKKMHFHKLYNIRNSKEVLERESSDSRQQLKTIRKEATKVSIDR